MNTGQTLITIMALSLLSVITMHYYGSVGTTGRIMSQSNAGLTAQTIATSYIEKAQKLAFDNITAISDTVLESPTALSSTLAKESGELSIDDFNDFDDFNNFYDTINSPWMNERYASEFKVYYVTTNINQKATGKSFVKRMDIKVWRCFPKIDTTEATIFDTVRTSTVMGYFKYSP